MVHALFLAAALSIVQERTPSDFLERVRIVETRQAEGELTLVDPDGESRTLHEGDLLPEAGGATIHEIGRSTLVLKRVVSGADGQKGEALIVVRFDRSGKTRVREYRTVPDVSLKATPHTEPREKR
jgi:hypothetical protein